MSQDNKESRICSMPVAVYVRDPLLRVQRDYGDPTMPLEQVQKELAQ